MKIFTVGHSNHELSGLLRLLQRHEITAVADVRSSPFSARLQQFNRPVLKTALEQAGMAYVFLGNELGARRSEQHCYVDGQARYDLIAKTTGFREGISRVLKGMEKYRMALLCAEKDPITCHRTILVCRELRRAGAEIDHILADGTLESQDEVEKRLRAHLGLDQPSLFETPEQQLEEAYHRQGLKIAYRAGGPESQEEEETTARI